MSAFNELAEFFRTFPGIGPRQAKRFVYYLLSRDRASLDRFTKLVGELKSEIRICNSCYRFFSDKNPLPVCAICSDMNRDRASLMIVARDTDLEAVEKSGVWSGQYFVLGGSVPLLEKAPESRIRSRELLARLQKEKNTIKEIVLGMNFTPEGENTADHIRDLIQPITEETGARVSTLGRGLSTGTELEYSDKETLKNALQNRH